MIIAKANIARTKSLSLHAVKRLVVVYFGFVHGVIRSFGTWRSFNAKRVGIELVMYALIVVVEKVSAIGINFVVVIGASRGDLSNMKQRAIIAMRRMTGGV